MAIKSPELNRLELDQINKIPDESAAFWLFDPICIISCFLAFKLTLIWMQHKNELRCRPDLYMNSPAVALVNAKTALGSKLQDYQNEYKVAWYSEAVNYIPPS